MLDHRRAALRRLLAAERSVDDGAGDIESERERGHAHRVRKIVGKLEVVSSYRGAYWSELDCSPELLRAAVGSGCCRGRCCGSLRSKKKARLDAQDRDGVVCVNERGRGGLVLTRRVAGVCRETVALRLTTRRCCSSREGKKKHCKTRKGTAVMRA